MKNTKKLLSLLLVLAMVFTLAVPVFAEGKPPKWRARPLFCTLTTFTVR